MTNEKSPWLQKPIHPALPAITNEVAIFAGIILLAIVTRVMIEADLRICLFSVNGRRPPA